MLCFCFCFFFFVKTAQDLKYTFRYMEKKLASLLMSSFTEFCLFVFRPFISQVVWWSLHLLSGFSMSGLKMSYLISLSACAQHEWKRRRYNSLKEGFCLKCKQCLMPFTLWLIKNTSSVIFHISLPVFSPYCLSSLYAFSSAIFYFFMPSSGLFNYSCRDYAEEEG